MCVRTYILTSAQDVHVQFVRSVLFVHLEVEQSRGVRPPYYLESKVQDPRYGMRYEVMVMVVMIVIVMKEVNMNICKGKKGCCDF